LIALDFYVKSYCLGLQAKQKLPNQGVEHFSKKLPARRSPGPYRYKSKQLSKYDKFKRFLDDDFEMPDKTVALLVRFLEKGGGVLS